MKKGLLWMLALGTAMVGCTETDVIGLDGGNEVDGKDRVEIKMATTVTGVEAVTRAPFPGMDPGVVPPPTQITKARVVIKKAASTDYGTPHADGTMSFGAANTAVGFDGTPIGVKYYPTDNSDLHFIGLYPETGWAHDVVSTLSEFNYIIDGNTDVMIARQKTNSKSNAQSDLHPNLEFEHILTRLDVKMAATDAEAITAWGDIKGVVLDGVLGGTKPNTNAIFKPTAATASMLSFDTPVAPGSFPMYECTGTATPTFTDVAFTGLSKPLVLAPAQYFAYTMMAPVTLTGTNHVTLKIYVENGHYEDAGGKYVTVSVDFPMTNPETAGRYYTITLNFNIEEIMASATVEDWKPGEDGTGEIG